MDFQCQFRRDRPTTVLPRDEFGPYTKFEIGFPSEKVDVLMDYAEEPDSPTDTVYGWVPVDLVVKIINEHGGIYGT